MDNLNLLFPALWQTIYMVFLSALYAVILGLPLGLLSVVTSKNHIMENTFINKILGFIINIFRSCPFIILVIILLPLTKILVGTSIGSTASVVPLAVASAPFFARIVEGAILEVSPGLIEASKSLGASNFHIITKVLIPEALPSLLHGLTLTLVSLIGYSAMVGAVGGGGLGDLALRFGYQRYDIPVLLFSVTVIIIIVQLVQGLGNLFVDKLRSKRGH